VTRARLAAAALLAACGSKDVPRERTRPDPTLTFEDHVARIDELSARACACQDRRCIAAIDRDLALLVTEVDLEGADPAVVEKETPARIEALERLAVCMTDHEVAASAYGEALAARLEELRDRTCACKEPECASRLAVSLDPERGTAEWFPIDYDLLVKMRALTASIDLCSDASGVATEALGAMEALRDAACACRDATCADQVQGRFNAFLAANEGTKSTQQVAIEIGRLASEMGECLTAARGEAAP
jgi:hypothetical protein